MFFDPDHVLLVSGLPLGQRPDGGAAKSLQSFKKQLGSIQVLNQYRIDIVKIFWTCRNIFFNVIVPNGLYFVMYINNNWRNKTIHSIIQQQLFDFMIFCYFWLNYWHTSCTQTYSRHGDPTYHVPFKVPKEFNRHKVQDNREWTEALQQPKIYYYLACFV